MKIHTRIKSGKLKGWTIRKSIWGWFDLYSKEGISQTTGKHTFESISSLIKTLQNEK
jgi:hypothetical protein